jgi:hypothetical protein
MPEETVLQELLQAFAIQLAVDSLEDENIIQIRYELADYTASQFLEVADEIAIQNKGRETEKETQAISILLKIGAALVSGASTLFQIDNAYAAAALVRQLVEIEYLAWAFEDNIQEAEKWINSSKDERMKFFTPAKLRQAAQGRFRGKDYGYHCELGGHPVPEAGLLLNNPHRTAQLLLSDMLGHSGRIWDHLLRWADGEVKQVAILSRREKMLERYVAWKSRDFATRLPPPP